MPVLRQAGDLGRGAVAQALKNRMQEPVHSRLGAGTRHLPRDRRGHRITKQRERHVPDGRDASGEGGKRPGPEVIHPDRLVLANRLAERGMHQVNVSIDAAGDDQQAVRVELLPPGHRTADLGDPAIPDPDIGDLVVARGDDGPAPDD